MNSTVHRLQEERNKWRRNPPNGFQANPSKNPDGTLNLFKWDCEIPGPRKTPWEHGKYKFTIEFNQIRLDAAPSIVFTPVIFHPNVKYNGLVCSNLVHMWPRLSLKQLLFAVQSFLEKPNPYAAENMDAKTLFLENREKYDERVRSEIKNHSCVSEVEQSEIIEID